MHLAAFGSGTETPAIDGQLLTGACPSAVRARRGAAVSGERGEAMRFSAPA
jgi:hypothetical protein